MNKGKRTLQHLWIPFCAIFLITPFWILALWAPTEETPQAPLADEIPVIYNTIKSVPQSRKLGALLEITVRERIACYSASPLTRLEQCLPPYLTSIVSMGRNNVRSAPDMGSFLRNVRFCPIAYSTCMGDVGNNDVCVGMEASCIDYVFDSYWRGAPFTNILPESKHNEGVSRLRSEPKTTSSN
ncbi:hypothetical protein FACS189497_00570 [Betaproteobacteria bacterium]|nr:hypothetical protein FACS189488_11290 [Betaproteobacteria bacterium]GHU27417.1 hypothetical protein FACS189497_00570 [Betaproteobacteria bacterium]